MTWFRPDAPRTVNDPVFGTITLVSGTYWDGTVAFPTAADTVAVTIVRGDQVPTAEDHRAFTDFAAVYSSLAPALMAELWRLLEPSLLTPGWKGPNPGSPDALWRMLQLEVVSIEPGRPLELMFAFRDDNVWPDAMFNVAVEGTQVRGLSLDD